jgi:hypothetical protein
MSWLAGLYKLKFLICHTPRYREVYLLDGRVGLMNVLRWHHLDIFFQAWSQ